MQPVTKKLPTAYCFPPLVLLHQKAYMELSTATRLIDHPSLYADHPTTWADLGCGEGFFTRALSVFLKEGSTIYAVDSNAASLKRITPPAGIMIKPFRLDFIKDSLPFENLNGIMMANSLHYVKHQQLFLEKAQRHVKVGGNILFIEYDTQKANPWVPYPVSYVLLEKLCKAAGFSSVEKINQIPSAFGRANMYAAVAF